MIKAYKQVVIRNYSNFNGRAARSEYWWFTLANLIIMVGFVALMFLLGPVLGDASFIVVSVASFIYFVAVLLPSIAVTVRRLHDIDKSAWWLLIGFIPWIGGLILLILMVLNTHPHSNKYGEPAGWQDTISA